MEAGVKSEKLYGESLMYNKLYRGKQGTGKHGALDASENEYEGGVQQYAHTVNYHHGHYHVVGKKPKICAVKQKAGEKEHIQRGTEI